MDKDTKSIAGGAWVVNKLNTISQYSNILDLLRRFIFRRSCGIPALEEKKYRIGILIEKLDLLNV